MVYDLRGEEQRILAEKGLAGKPWTVAQARAMLKEGNERYQRVHTPPTAADASLLVKVETEKAADKYPQQRPFAAILSCADSRVAPEIVFDQPQGRLFVIRTAGNTSDEKVIANIAYALHVLAVPLVVVMGHEGCGAVGAAINQVNGAQIDCRISAFVDPIVPVVEPADGRGEVEHLAYTVKANVRQTAKTLRAVQRLQCCSRPPLIDQAYYHFGNGAVEMVEDPG